MSSVHSSHIEYSSSIVEMLGQLRIDGIQESLAKLHDYIASVPERGSWVKHLPIPLKATSQNNAKEEIEEILKKSGPDWYYVIGLNRDGSHFALASELFHQTRSDPRNDIIDFLMFDIRSSLEGWWLSHIWRAADLAESASVSLEQWLVLPAAACIRALLEGVAAFVIEGEDLINEWFKFKQKGIHDLAGISAFREEFNAKLLQTQFGSRLGERSKARSSKFKRTNVLTLIEKYGKHIGVDIWTPYEWLCDAVHPSYGFGTVYIATQGVHETGATFAADLARRTDIVQTLMPKIESTVALATAEVFVLAIQSFLKEAPRLRNLIDDFSLAVSI